MNFTADNALDDEGKVRNQETDLNIKSRRTGRFIYRLFIVLTYVITGLSLVVFAMAVAAFVAYQHIIRPGTPGRTITFTVPEGATGQEIGSILQQQGLIEHRGMFRLALRLEDAPGSIRHGIYEIPKGYSTQQILHKMYEGPKYHLHLNQVRVTIPEGLSLQQMAGLFDNADAFLQAASNPAYTRQLGLDVDTLEGFLMPDTYFFSDIPSEAEVVERMFQQFLLVLDELSQELPASQEIDTHLLVTVASLVERESRVAEERPLVAAVIYNRLENNMPLQMDSTLQYALNKYGQRMLDVDKEVESPYNTYMYRGLPPGPIASPSRSSMEAVLNPANVDYLYFVSNADGQTHTFSSNYDEHLRAVQRYRQEIAEQRRALGSQ